MKNTQQGFTFIELMMIVTIIGVLAAIAIPSYQTYTIRAQISEGLNLTGPLRTAVAEYYGHNGAFPSDNIEAGVDAAGNYSGKYVVAISVNGAVISIQYANDADAAISGETVTLTAVGDLGSLRWTCASGGTINADYLPSSCG